MVFRGRDPTMEGRRARVVFASMPPAPGPLQLHRATLRVAAISFWGLASIVMATNFIGNDLHVNYTTEWVVTGLAYGAGVVWWFLPWGHVRGRRFIPVVFGGIGMLTVGLFATGGTHSHLSVLFLVIVVFGASVLEFRIAVGTLVACVVAAGLPLVLQGWDGLYARSFVLLAVSMVICAYIPAIGRRALSKENQLAERRRMELEDSYLSTIEALAAALDAKDRHTEAHSRETAALARAVGHRLGLEDEALRFLEYGALLHDIGKIGIPGYVLNKPGALDEEETAIMREHPVIGERIRGGHRQRHRPQCRPRGQATAGGPLLDPASRRHPAARRAPRQYRQRSGDLRDHRPGDHDPAALRPVPHLPARRRRANAEAGVFQRYPAVGIRRCHRRNAGHRGRPGNHRLGSRNQTGGAGWRHGAPSEGDPHPEHHRNR